MPDSMRLRADEIPTRQLEDVFYFAVGPRSLRLRWCGPDSGPIEVDLHEMSDNHPPKLYAPEEE
jgi:hypothetical protein